MNSRIGNILLSLVITLFYGAFVTIGYNATGNRILQALGGAWPYGLVQMATFFLFFWGILEVVKFFKFTERETNALKSQLLPEKEQFILSADDVNDLKLQIIDVEKSSPSLLTDMIKKACTKFRANKSVSEALSVVDAQTDINIRISDAEQTLIKYLSWAIQSLGLLGTVLGIGAALSAANEIVSQDGIKRVTSLLSVAFDTTFVAISLSIILMYFFGYVSERTDKLHSENQSYVIENLINRIYNK
ncbi:MAG: MotA/TolQ/ExbB proton channel family protein [Saprospiraceae bacterium]|nr:MotA/TolQ/ExbB proton channel family protein [Saprospiraceae bacterium]